MSYTSLRYHIVFGTKERRPFLTAPLRPRICEFLAGMIRRQGGHPVLINGPEDHVHIVAEIPPTLAIADSLRDLKANCTNWIHDTLPDMKTFSWQEGYSAFSVSPSVLPNLLRYVRNQQEHHKKTTFTDEMIWLLKSHGIIFDEKYLA
ncbi:MAG: IS200/IS605 family transposase [Phycisphaerae bacterium]